MFCLCAITNDKDSCAGGTNIAGTVLSARNPHATALETLISKCPKKTLDKQLDDGITLALAAFLGQLGQLADNQNKIGLDRTVNGDVCTVKSSACVDYTDKIKDVTKVVKKIAWIWHLLTAKKLFSEYKQQAAHKQLLIKDIDNLSKQAEHEHGCKQALEPTSGPPRAGTLGKGEQLSTKQECDKHHASPDNCTKGSCDYDAKNKKYKPKARSEPTAAGTRADSTGYARHQNQPDSENDKTGDKQNLSGGREKMVKMIKRQKSAALLVFC
uniref:Variant surface glycoprotein 1125.5649 n=1 Tax=Trypanosoma brucei TaxID=5691 RepID=A0A1J0RCU6_9TRYP|nr:variant surface glycoprotein 1125.5649 [Trypanosoma brucei]